jgi:hypothetical protein
MRILRIRAVLGQVFPKRFCLPCQLSFFQLLNVSCLLFETGTAEVTKGSPSTQLHNVKKVQHFILFFFCPLDTKVTELMTHCTRNVPSHTWSVNPTQCLCSPVCTLNCLATRVHSSNHAHDICCSLWIGK